MLIKQFLCALLLLAFSCQVFNRACIVTSYYTNTAAYLKNCENKAKPMLHCNGKCQMLKKLKAEEKKDQQNPERRTDTKMDPYCSINSHSGILFSAALAIQDLPYISNGGTPVKMPRNLLRPPAC